MLDVRRERMAFDDIVRRFFGAEREDMWLRTEEFYDDDMMVVRAEMPGIDPDKDVELTMADGMLRIKAERRETVEHKEKGGYRSEFHYGSFVRDVLLPSDCKAEEIAATYKDGVLEVRVPRRPEVKPEPTKVPVQRA